MFSASKSASHRTSRSDGLKSQIVVVQQMLRVYRDLCDIEATQQIDLLPSHTHTMGKSIDTEVTFVFSEPKALGSASLTKEIDKIEDMVNTELASICEKSKGIEILPLTNAGKSVFSEPCILFPVLYWLHSLYIRRGLSKIFVS